MLPILTQTLRHHLRDPTFSTIIITTLRPRLIRSPPLLRPRRLLHHPLMLLPLPRLDPHPQRPLLLIPDLQLPEPGLALLPRLLLLHRLVVLLPLLPVRLPVHAAHEHGGDGEALGVDAAPEEAVGLGVVADPHAARGAEESPACQRAAERDERLFFEAAAELLPAVFLVEVAVWRG